VGPALAALKAPAGAIGLGHAAEAVALQEDGVRISVLYFLRKGA
jgi:hypothetical protein